MSHTVKAIDTHRNQRPCERGIRAPSETRYRESHQSADLAIIESFPRPISWMYKRNLILERVLALFHRIQELY